MFELRPGLGGARAVVIAASSFVVWEALVTVPAHLPDELLQRVHPLGAGIAAVDVENLQGSLVLLAPPECVHEDVVQRGHGLIKLQIFQQQGRQPWKRRDRYRIHPYGTGCSSLGSSVIGLAGHIREFRRGKGP